MPPLLIVIFGIGLGFEALAIVLFLCRLCRSGACIRDKCTCFVQDGVRRLSVALGAKGDDVEHSEIAEQAKLSSQARRLALARHSSCAVMLFFMLRLPFLVWETWAHGHSNSSAYAGSFVLILVASSVVTLRPALITDRSVVWWHGFLMGCMCVMQSPWGAEAEFAMLFVRPMLIVLSTVVSVGCLRFAVLLVTNALLFAAVILQYSAADAVLGVEFHDILISEVAMLCAKMLLLWGIETYVESEALREIKASEGQCQRSAVSALLGMVCDAVVDVDAHLRLKEVDPSLSGLLMHGSGKVLRGTDFIGYLDHDDDHQSRFEANIASNVAGRDGAPRPGVFGGRLRDAMGNRISAHFFHVPYASVSGSVHHLLGIREDVSAVDSWRMLSEQQPPEAVLTEDIMRSLNGPPRSADDVSSTGQSQTTSVPGGEVIVVDTLVADRLPIQGATQSFWSTIDIDGAAEQPCLADALGDLDAERLSAWVCERAGSASRHTAFIQSFGKVKVRRTTRGQPAWVTWGVQVCFPPRDNEDDKVSVRLVPSRRRQGGSPGGAQGTPAGAVALPLVAAVLTL